MSPEAARPHVVIIGGGFGGMTAAQSLARAPVRITLIDSRNHHLFQPLLYQVAMAGLSPADIAAPIRSVLRKQRNVTVLLAEARSIDLASKTVALDRDELRYDYLIVAAGAQNHYFGHEDWARHAVGLKDVEDAVEIRGRVLLAFEARRALRDDHAGAPRGPAERAALDDLVGLAEPVPRPEARAGRDAVRA